MIRMHEDVFYSYFSPYKHPESKFDSWGGLGIETFGSDLSLMRKLDKEYVWTVIDGCDDNSQWIITGFHHVNRICYLVTKKPHLWIDVEFRISSSSLTDLGLKRQLSKLDKIHHSNEFFK